MRRHADEKNNPYFFLLRFLYLFVTRQISEICVCSNAECLCMRIHKKIIRRSWRSVTCARGFRLLLLCFFLLRIHAKHHHTYTIHFFHLFIYILFSSKFIRTLFIAAASVTVFFSSISSSLVFDFLYCTRDTLLLYIGFSNRAEMERVQKKSHRYLFTINKDSRKTAFLRKEYSHPHNPRIIGLIVSRAHGEKCSLSIYRML